MRGARSLCAHTLGTRSAAPAWDRRPAPATAGEPCSNWPDPRSECLAAAGTPSHLAPVEVAHRVLPGTAQVVHGFVVNPGDVDRGQIPAPQKAGQRDCIAAVRLHSVARLPRNQRRGDDRTRESLAGQVSIQPVAARPRLVDEDERGAPFDSMRLTRVERRRSASSRGSHTVWAPGQSRAESNAWPTNHRGSRVCRCDGRMRISARAQVHAWRAEFGH